ncbi:MAG: polymer-forming cytoskeletal protein [Candidatus Puniceispirillum sp.]|nr:polymer-forming cytoskeletal protein [Candidatus Puniceispirillum sp.]
MDKLGSKTIIGNGATFTGKIANARVIEVHGKVNADLTAEKVTIGEAGHFDGAIRADLVVVSGHYEGKIQAGSVWATATASISGKLHYKTLQMDRGAALNCHIVHNWTAKDAAPVQSDNKGVNLPLPKASDKAKNGAVLSSHEEGA